MECGELLPATTPPGCGEAKCNLTLGSCEFFAKDKDDDGHPAKDCTTLGDIQISVGDDCDDEDADVYPGSGIERCNGVDDDCDGEVDEDVPPLQEPCSVGIGECERTGVKVCEGGAYTGCSASPGAAGMELCDGLDNNCDGETDEGFGVGAACTGGVGACCRAGNEVCSPSATETACDAVAGAPDDGFHSEPAVGECGESFDWNCDGDLEPFYEVNWTFGDTGCAQTQPSMTADEFCLHHGCQGDPECVGSVCGWYYYASVCGHNACGDTIFRTICRDASGYCRNEYPAPLGWQPLARACR